VTLYPPGAERWRAIPFAPDYLVSDQGRVKRITPGNGTQMRALRPHVGKDGFCRVNLRIPTAKDDRREGRKRKTKGMLVHTLVLSAFVRLPRKGERCEHIDGNNENNVLANLRWRVPPSPAKKKLTAEQAAAIRADPRAQRVIAAEYGVSTKNVWLIKKGLLWASATNEGGCRSEDPARPGRP
jgi:hypothetical protein